MKSALPDCLDKVDIGQLSDTDPLRLAREPRGLATGDVPTGAPVLAYAHRTGAASYDEVGFRVYAASPKDLSVGLATLWAGAPGDAIASEESSSDDFECIKEEQGKLAHRSLDLPPVLEGGFDFLAPDPKTLVFKWLDANSGWSTHRTFSISYPPRLIWNNSEPLRRRSVVARDFHADTTGIYWLPLRHMISTGRFPRWQESQSELSTGRQEGNAYLFVSHRWLATDQPDPNGLQARLLSWQIFAAMCEAVRVACARGIGTPARANRTFGRVIGIHGNDLSESLIVDVLLPSKGTEADALQAELESCEEAVTDNGLRSVQEDADLSKLRLLIAERPGMRALMDKVFVWCDYSCLPQQPRSAEEEHLFRVGLSKLHLAQLLSRTVVLLDRPDDYLGRAWCTLESVFSHRYLAGAHLLAGSDRAARSGSAERRWMTELLADRHNLIWRALLDTLVFAIQDWRACMQRLGLEVTERADLEFVYNSLLRIPAPTLTATGDNALITGTFPVCASGKSVRWARRCEMAIRREVEDATIGEVDWRSALRLPERNEQSPIRHLEPLVTLAVTGRNPPAHLVIVASCEGEAMLMSDWARTRSLELGEALGVEVASMSWLAVDTVPVGALVEGRLRAVPIDQPNWIIAAAGLWHSHSSVLGLIRALAEESGAAVARLTLDQPTDNVRALLPWPRTHCMPQEAPDSATDHITLDRTTLRTPIHLGGLFRADLMQYLLSTERT